MRRELPGGFELDDAPARVDLGEVHRFLSTDSYWARGRSREDVERSIRASARVVGLYEGSRQIGFARAVSDGVVMAWLADVYVLPEYRGHGLGVELVREIVEGGPYERCSWFLHTADAFGLYEKFGFGKPSERLMYRPGAAHRAAAELRPTEPRPVEAPAAEESATGSGTPPPPA